MKRIAIVLVVAIILLCSCHSWGTLQRGHISTDGSSLRSTSAEEGPPSQALAPDGEHSLGLLIAAHGSPRPQWNEQLAALESEVRILLNTKESSPFRMIRVGMMEFAEPTIASVLQDMELHGVQKVYVLPLFIAPSSHSVFDLPAILGLYSDSKIRDQLQAEGTTIAATNMRVTLGPTLNYAAVLKEVMLDRARDLSREPQSEGIVLLAHGDPLFAPFWESLCQEIGYFVCAHTGIRTFDFAFVEMGQSFIPNGVPAIRHVAERCQRTLVLGLYVSTSVQEMVDRWELSAGQVVLRAPDMLADHRVTFAQHGLLPSERVVAWIAERAMEWVSGRR